MQRSLLATAQLDLQFIALVQQIVRLFMSELCTSTTLHRRLEALELVTGLVVTTVLQSTREAIELRFELCVMTDVQIVTARAFIAAGLVSGHTPVFNR